MIEHVCNILINRSTAGIKQRTHGSRLKCFIFGLTERGPKIENIGSKTYDIRNSVGDLS